MNNFDKTQLHAHISYSELNIISKILVRLTQNVSNFVVPRGLPRISWLSRRLILGYGFKKVSYLNRFYIYCDTDRYYDVTFIYRIQNKKIDKLLERILQPGDIFFDIGANIGMISLLACSSTKVKGKLEVHCFEPNHNAFSQLLLNMSLNNFNVICKNCAVGATNRQGELTIGIESGWSTMITEPEEGFSFLTKTGKQCVEIITLDEYCETHRITPTILKIDVEGYETEVLHGSKKIIQQSTPTMIIEINPLRLQVAGSSEEELLDILYSLGYKTYHIEPQHMVKNKSMKSWHGLPEAKTGDVPMGSISDILAIHQSKEFYY